MSKYKVIEDIYYRIRCLNEWCDGPEKIKLVTEKPTAPIPCPTCGYLAMPNCRTSVQRVESTIEVLDEEAEIQEDLGGEKCE